jgi:hypothetical protein
MSDDDVRRARQMRVEAEYRSLCYDLKGAVFMGLPLDRDDPKQVAVALWYLLDIHAIQRLMPDDQE